MAQIPPKTPSVLAFKPVLDTASSPDAGTALNSDSEKLLGKAGATWVLTLIPTGQRLPVLPGQTLWQALHASGVGWPVSCRNGSCRSCMGVLLQGRVRYTVDWPGLLPEEKTQGCVLPCVACALTDVVLARP